MDPNLRLRVWLRRQLLKECLPHKQEDPSSIPRIHRTKKSPVSLAYWWALSQWRTLSQRIARESQDRTAAAEQKRACLKHTIEGEPMPGKLTSDLFIQAAYLPATQSPNHHKIFTMLSGNLGGVTLSQEKRGGQCLGTGPVLSCGPYT